MGTGSGCCSNGLSSSRCRSNFTNRFILKNATRFDRHHPYFAQAFRYFSTSMVIIAVQICINTALGEVPRKDLIFRSCLMSLKNCSMSQRALYRSDMVFAVQKNWFVISSMVYFVPNHHPAKFFGVFGFRFFF